jgi:hypothetical protein
MPVISALGRWRQEAHEFEVSLDYILRFSLKNPMARDIALVECLPSMP